MTEHQVHLIGGEDDEKAIILCARRDPDCHLTIQFRDRVIEANALDYFEAFCKLRLELEKARLIPFCYGASLNIFPSSMCRDMGAGMFAYRLTMGVKPSSADLVRIFNADRDVIPAFVSRQKEFHEEWLASIGIQTPSKP